MGFYVTTPTLKFKKGDKNMELNKRQPNGLGVPDPPKMKFDENGRPCFDHLETNEEDDNEQRFVRNADNTGIPQMPTMLWKLDKSGKHYIPDFDHLQE